MQLAPHSQGQSDIKHSWPVYNARHLQIPEFFLRYQPRRLWTCLLEIPHWRVTLSSVYWPIKSLGLKQWLLRVQGLTGASQCSCPKHSWNPLLTAASPEAGIDTGSCLPERGSKTTQKGAQFPLCSATHADTWVWLPLHELQVLTVLLATWQGLTKWKEWQPTGCMRVATRAGLPFKQLCKISLDYEIMVQKMVKCTVPGSPRTVWWCVWLY